MSVSTNQNRFSQVGDGVNDTFIYPSYFKAKPDILVIVTDDAGNVSVKTLDVDYSINGAVTAGFGYVNGASIVFGAAPANNETVIIINNPSPLQSTVLAANSVYPPQKIESTLDAIVLFIQRIFSLLSRAVTLKDGMIDTFDPSLPVDLASVANQGKVIITDPAGGNKFVMGPSADEISDAAAQAAAAAASAAAALASENTAVAAAVQATQSAADAQAFLSDFNEIDTSGGNVNVTLPPAIDGIRIISYINKNFGGAFSVIVGKTGGDTIHGDANDVLAAGEVGQYWSNGTDTWYRIN